jgi:hypothetical protein
VFFKVNPVPAEYVVFVSVFVSVDVMVKFGYVPLIVVAPLPVNVTVWSGAAFLNSVPTNVKPVPAVYVVFVSVLVSVDEIVITPPSCVIVVAPPPTKVKSPGAFRNPLAAIVVIVSVSVFVSVDAKLNTPADVSVIVTFEPPTKLISPVL